MPLLLAAISTKLSNCSISQLFAQRLIRLSARNLQHPPSLQISYRPCTLRPAAATMAPRDLKLRFCKRAPKHLESACPKRKIPKESFDSERQGPFLQLQQSQIPGRTQKSACRKSSCTGLDPGKRHKHNHPSQDRQLAGCQELAAGTVECLCLVAGCPQRINH